MHIVRQLLLPLPAVLLLFAACNNHGEKNATADLTTPSPVATDTIAMPNGNLPPQEPQKNAPAPKEDWDKKIIKTATLTLEVKNYQAFNELLHTGIKETGGYIAQEEQNQSAYKIENVVTVKVPVDQFDNALARLVPAGEKLVEKKIATQDVTSEVVDTKSRLEAKKMVRLRYLDLLKQAKNMKEILEVQNEINSIQEEEESAAGRIQYLSHASAYSTIHLVFYQVLNASAGETPPAPSFGTRILDAFVSGLKWFGGLLVTFVTIWPLWLSLIMAWVIIKRYKGVIDKKSQ